MEVSAGLLVVLDRSAVSDDEAGICRAAYHWLLRSLGLASGRHRGKRQMAE